MAPRIVSATPRPPPDTPAPAAPEGELSDRTLDECPDVPPPPRRAKRPSPQHTHYRVICISIYTDDLAELDAKVETLKARGLTKANRSTLIRYALAGIDPETLPLEAVRRHLGG